MPRSPAGSPILGSPATPGVAGLATRRSATPVAVTAPSAAARVFGGRYRFTKAHGLIAGTLLGGIGALLAWGFQGSHDGGEGASEANTSAETRTAPLGGAESGAARPRTAGSASSRATAQPTARPSENLVILQTDELPRAPDETADEEESGGAESGATGSAGSHSAGSHRAPVAGAASAKAAAGSSAKALVASASPKPGAAATAGAAPSNARLDPGSSTAHAATKPRATAATPRRETSHRSAKHASADCNPPYFFDNNNIRRLKLECL
jgi:hypothetical protein